MELEEAYGGVVARWKTLDAADRAPLLESFAVSWAYNSGKIENDAITYHDTHEVFDYGRVIGYTGDVKTLFEIQNLKNIWAWTMARYGDLAKAGLSVEAMLDAHAVVTRGTYSEKLWGYGERPGSYKRGEYVVGVSGVGSPASEVSGEMVALAAEMDEVLQLPNAKHNALTIAAYLHARLVDIHPFADGNGRVARALTNLVLLGLGHPPVAVAESHRIAYYGALDQFHDVGELDSFKLFLRAETVSCWMALLGKTEDHS